MKTRQFLSCPDSRCATTMTSALLGEELREAQITSLLIEIVLGTSR
jgi:hypothetical protein